MLTVSRRALLKAGGGASMLTLAPSLRAAISATSDSQWVRAALEALHPGLYRYQTPEQFAARHAAFAAAFDAGDFNTRVLALQKLLAAVRCGHTYINPFNQSDAIMQSLYGARRVVPWHFRWIGDAMVVTSDPYTDRLAAGMKVLSIDGQPVSEILARLLPHARGDGGNDAKRRALMSVNNAEEWGMFDLYFDLVFKPGATIEVLAETSDTRRWTMRLALIPYAARSALRPGETVDPTAPLWSARTAHGGKTRIITMPTWAVYNSKWDWEGWLRGQLAEITTDGTSGLVIDLRANEGGLTIGDALLAFFLQAPLTVPRPAQRVRFREVPTDLRPLLDTWDPSFYELGKDGVALDSGLIETGPVGETVIMPEAQTFGGRIAVLIGADNSSATFQFAQQVRAAGRATLIGEPTGGNLRGINGGAFFFARLPESGIEFDIPLIGTFPPGEPADAGLEPDEYVAQSAADIAAGHDPAMARALEVVA